MPRPLVLIAACLFSALAYGISGCIALTFASLAMGGLAPDADIVLGLVLYTIVLGLYGLAVAVVFSLPMHALLMRLRRTGLIACCMGGLIPGLLISTLLMILADPGLGVAERLLLFGASLVTAVCGAAAFWLIARPDRRAASRQAQP